MIPTQSIRRTKVEEEELILWEYGGRGTYREQPVTVFQRRI
jgi:hypothetical protein